MSKWPNSAALATVTGAMLGVASVAHAQAFQGAYILNQEAAEQHARYRINGTATSASLATTAGGLSITSNINTTAPVTIHPTGAAGMNQGPLFRYVPADTDQGVVGIGVQEGAIVQAGQDDMAADAFSYNSGADPAFKAGEAQFYLRFESDFLTSGHHQSEWYLQWFGTDGVTSRRPFFGTFRKDNNEVSLSFAATTFNWLNDSGAQVLSYVDANDIIKFYKGVVFAENQSFSALAGTGQLDFHLMTGNFQTPGGASAATFNGASNNFTNLLTANGGISDGSTLGVTGVSTLGGGGAAISGAGNGDLVFDNHSATSPGVKFYNGDHSNGAINVASGAIQFTKKLGESGQTQLLKIDLASANTTFNGAVFTGSVDTATAAALGIGNSNATEVDIRGPIESGSGSTAHAALNSGDIWFDANNSDTPGIHFYNGANSNGGIDVQGGNLRFAKNLDESGSSNLFTCALASANCTFNGAIFATSGVDRSSAAALSIGASNASEVDLGSGSTPVVVSGRVSATGSGTFLGVLLTSGAEPTCDSSIKGKLWYVAGAAGVADTVKACTKDAADAYAWRALY